MSAHEMFDRLSDWVASHFGLGAISIGLLSGLAIYVVLSGLWIGVIGCPLAYMVFRAGIHGIDRQFPMLSGAPECCWSVR